MKEYFESVFARTRGSGALDCRTKLGRPARGRDSIGPVRRGAKFLSESEAGQPFYSGKSRSRKKRSTPKNG